LLRLGDSYQLATKNEYSVYVKNALTTRQESFLSGAALEVLAIVAYHQPVTRGYINQVRGVDCNEVMDKLEEKRLIEECGRLDAPGKPRLFATTPDFLRTFGLSSIEDLPRPEAPESPSETQKFEV
jgi:segregation and condensation protein B